MYISPNVSYLLLISLSAIIKIGKKSLDLLHHLVKDANMAQLAFSASCFCAICQVKRFLMICPGYVRIAQAIYLHYSSHI